LIWFYAVLFCFCLAVSVWGDDMDVASQKISLAICSIINLIQLTAGAIAAIVIIFAGVRWVMSDDDVSARNGAKTTIIAAFAGIVIIAVGIPVVNLVVGGVINGVSCSIIPGADLARAAGGGNQMGGVESPPEQNLPNLQIADISAGPIIGENMGLDLEVIIKNAGTADAYDVRVQAFRSGGDREDMCSGIAMYMSMYDGPLKPGSEATVMCRITKSGLNSFTG